MLCTVTLMDVAVHFIIVSVITQGHGSTAHSTLCGNCMNEPDTDYTDKRVTSGVLWTDPNLQSRIECASRSFLFPVIKSYGFNENTRECVAYTVPLSTSPATVAESGFNMFSTCAPVDGVFTTWTSWGGASCTATCGPTLSVVMTRTRSCTNPPPDNGGADCTGEPSETGNINCELPECSVDGGFTEWTSWSGSCSLTCGSSETYQRTKTRTCTDPAPAHGGADCVGDTEYTETGVDCGFTDCPVDGGFTEWTSWSGSCSLTCGSSETYQRTKTRTCTDPVPAHGGADCVGDTEYTETGVDCGYTDCPVDGGFTEWTSWSGSCSLTCGSSETYQRTKTRTCTYPAPAHGGADCVGDTGYTETGVDCGFTNCPVNGVWGFWSGWSSCSSTCDTSASRSRSRSCNSPPPTNGGANCPGSSSENLSCGNLPCPVMDSTFGGCSSTCSGTNIVCEQGNCVCDIFYNYWSGTCVQGCSSYSSSFTSFYDKVLNGYNDRVVDNVMSLYDCKSLCLAESSFLCVTADWEKNSKTCYMSKTTWFGAPDGRSTSTSYYQLIRNCA